MKKLTFLTLLILYAFQSSAQYKNSYQVDVCVYSGTSAGIIAAYAAKKMGRSVIIVSPEAHIGGMTSGGLGHTDIGNKYAVTGLSRRFYRQIGEHYGKFEKWQFEPHVAEDLFKKYVATENIEVLMQYRITNAEKVSNILKSITVENAEDLNQSITIKAKMFIDCSYEGDLLAKAGVSFVVGREANAEFNEKHNGVFLSPDRHQFGEKISPYIIADDPTSGLLWGVNPEPIKEIGSGDNKLQAYNFRLCLTQDEANKIPFAKPDNYDPKKYELLKRLMTERDKTWQQHKFDYYVYSERIPNGKTDTNNKGPFSTDYIGGNHDYIAASYQERKRIWKEHEDYIKGFLYFMCNGEGVPERIKKDACTWGFTKDEFVDNGGFSYQLYVREGRRMRGEYVMTEHNYFGDSTVTDGIGLASYKIDSHNADRHIIDGYIKNEGNVEAGNAPPYPIAYRAITPKRQECQNLLVPVCLSATHTAYGSIRMEPVFMVLAQAAGVAASMAIKNNTAVQNINVKELQNTLLTNPYLDGKQAEIQIDDEDNEAMISYEGEWKRYEKSKDSYKKTFLTNQTIGGKLTITPHIPKKGKYKVYSYVPLFRDNDRDENVAPTFQWIVKSGKSEKMMNIPVNNDKNDWVFVGEFQFEKGNKNTLTLLPSKEGEVVFDALIIQPTE